MVSEVSDVDTEDALCEKCGLGDDPANFLLCDDCPRGWHLYCLTPKLRRTPSGRWSCPTCKDAKPRSRRARPARGAMA